MSTNATAAVEIAGQSYEVAPTPSFRAVDAVIEQAIARPTAAPVRRWERTIKDMGTLSDALASLEARIRAEDLRDVTDVRAQALRMDSEGRMYRLDPQGKPGKALPYTHDALQHTVSYLSTPRGTTGVLEFLRPAARAVAFEDLAVRAPREAAITMRTLVSKGQRIIRAVTSDRHSLTAGDDGAIVRALRGMVNGDAKARITRQWDRSDFEIVIPTRAREVKRGDLVYAKIHISNSETKGGSLEIFGGLHRLVCENGIVASVNDAASGFSIRHVGDVTNRLNVALRVAVAGIEAFAVKFGEAYAVPLVGTRAETLERVGRAFPGLGEDLLKTAERVWDADGVLSAGDTLAGAANALTRAAQDHHMGRALDAEIAAGRLVNVGWGALN